MYGDMTYSKYRDKKDKQRTRRKRRKKFLKVMGLTVLLGMVLVAAVILVLAFDRITSHDRTAEAVAAAHSPQPTQPPQNRVEIDFADELPREASQPPVAQAESIVEANDDLLMPPNYNPYHHDRAEAAKRSMGMFEITAFCPCKLCTGIWSRCHPDNIDNPDFVQRTASGTIPAAGRTAAINLSLFHFGQEIYIAGIGWRVAEDTGSAVFENVIDIFMDCHQEALRFGRQQREVFIWL